MSAPTPVPALWFQADKVAGAHDSDVAVWVDSQNSVPALGKAYGPAGVFPKIRRDEARPYVRLGTGNNSADNGGYFDLGPRIWALGRTASPEAGHRRGGGGRTSADGVCERQGVGARELAGCFFERVAEKTVRVRARVFSFSNKAPGSGITLPNGSPDAWPRHRRPPACPA